MFLVLRKILFRSLLLLCVAAGTVASFSLRMGGVVPDDFPGSRVPEGLLAFDSWRTYGAMEWRRLAQKAQMAGDVKLAEQALHRAWAADLSDGSVVGAMIGLRSNQGNLNHFNALAELAESLWPKEFAEMRRQRLGLEMERKP